MVHLVTGLVTRLYLNETACNIKLGGVSPLPKDEYFRLEKTHPNYNSLYSLALGAAMNRYPLGIRTKEEISATLDAQVLYFVADW